MPFVTTGMAVNSSRQEIGYELYVRPLYAMALVDIMSHYDWKEVWYIYDSNEGRQFPENNCLSRNDMMSRQEVLLIDLYL
jgi:hypothetical protein